MDLLGAFPLRSFQVDGGSGFMAEFEIGCEEIGPPCMSRRRAAVAKAAMERLRGTGEPLGEN